MQAWLRAKGLLPETAELRGDTTYTPFPLWRELACCLSFHTTWVLLASLGQHINIKEPRFPSSTLLPFFFLGSLNKTE